MRKALWILAFVLVVALILVFALRLFSNRPAAAPAPPASAATSHDAYIERTVIGYLSAIGTTKRVRYSGFATA
jgi:hypothetical protein